jgi:hypothetical protein
VFIEPALASLADVAPGGPGWLHEIKFDGYRLQIEAPVLGPVALQQRESGRTR